MDFKPEDPGEYWLDVQYDGASIFKKGDLVLQVIFASSYFSHSYRSLNFCFIIIRLGFLEEPACACET